MNLLHNCTEIRKPQPQAGGGVDSMSRKVLPSYRALKPWALTAKSVVNHSVRIEPVLTTEDGSWNPDNLNHAKHRNRMKKHKFVIQAHLMMSSRVSVHCRIFI